MTDVSQQIEELLVEHFTPTSVSVMDDSALHAGHAGARPGGQTHFTVRVVSERFEGKNQVARHRMIYATLQPLFDAGLHALVIEALTVEEANK